MPRVIVVSSDRSDLTILDPVCRALSANDEIELHMFLTGAHCGDNPPEHEFASYGETHSGGAVLGGDDPERAAQAMASIAAAAAKLYEVLEPDLLFVAGDRLDMFPAVVASVPFNLPVAHLHGGEFTLGAMDDRIRHATSKLAHLHFVASIDAAEHLSEIGEEAWRIRICGAPSLDQLLATPAMSADEFAVALGLRPGGFRLVTIHPETNSADPLAPARAVLAALERTPAQTLFTAPNSDPGGEAIASQIRATVARNPWASFTPHLGTRLYANGMRHADIMIGNSSSGVIEASLFGLPVVNVGRRQEGRWRGPNVRDVAAHGDAVHAAIVALSGRRFPSSFGPNGDGHASDRIAAVLAELPPRRRLLDKRAGSRAPFVAPWNATASSDAL
jgi:UDP-hydrolysing UDP-N-acetyl-D-glucosamine 2-epimerase